MSAKGMSKNNGQIKREPGDDTSHTGASLAEHQGGRHNTHADQRYMKPVERDSVLSRSTDVGTSSGERKDVMHEVISQDEEHLNLELVSLRRQCETLHSKCDFLRKDREFLKERCKTLQKERDEAVARSATLEQERDELHQMIARYNPEVINRQEEISTLHQYPTKGTSRPKATKTTKPTTATTTTTVEATITVRQDLACTGATGSSIKHVIDGQTRFEEFRAWLVNRPTVADGDSQTIAKQSSIVFKGSSCPLISPSVAHLCKAPPLFVSSFVTWYSTSLQHGMVVCPEYFYGLKNPYTAPTWSKVAEWRACGEHEREVFWVLPNGHTGYAGMYMCHTGPDKLQVHDLDDIQTDTMISHLVHHTHHSGTPNANHARKAIRELYTEGKLTVGVMGLERIGFNDALVLQLRGDLRVQETQEKKKNEKKLKKSLRKKDVAGIFPPVDRKIPVPPLPPGELDDWARRRPRLTFDSSAACSSSLRVPTMGLPPMSSGYPDISCFAPFFEPSLFPVAPGGGFIDASMLPPPQSFAEPLSVPPPLRFTDAGMSFAMMGHDPALPGPSIHLDRGRPAVASSSRAVQNSGSFSHGSVDATPHSKPERVQHSGEAPKSSAANTSTGSKRRLDVEDSVKDARALKMPKVEARDEECIVAKREDEEVSFLVSDREC